jgi:hypothetical protein
VGMNKSVCCDTGRKLEKDQIPDGGHDGEKAKTLTPEQTPDDAASIKTDMVAKSHGAVKKEASLEDIKKAKAKKEDEKVKADVEDLKKAKAKKEKAASEEEGEKAEEEAEKKEEKAKELLEEADKDEKKAEEAEGEKDATVEPIAAVKPIAALEPSSSTFEGIELMTSMDEVELDAGEAAELSKLFE